jgi:hypothetical protein
MSVGKVRSILSASAGRIITAIVAAGAAIVLSACGAQQPAETYVPQFDCSGAHAVGLAEAWQHPASDYCDVDGFWSGNTLDAVQLAAVDAGWPDHPKHGSDAGSAEHLEVLYRHAAEVNPDKYPIRLGSVCAEHEAQWAEGVLLLAPNHPYAAQIRAAVDYFRSTPGVTLRACVVGG